MVDWAISLAAESFWEEGAMRQREIDDGLDLLNQHLVCFVDVYCNE
jgi:hypothetical protein